MHIRNDEYPYTGWARDFPHTSFPTPRDGLDFPEQEIYWVHSTPQPEHDPDTEMVAEGQPEQVEGQWRQTWEVMPLPPEPVPVEIEGWQGEVIMRADKVDPEDPESPTVWDRVQALIAAMPDSIEKITAQTVLARGRIRRDSPTLAVLAPLVPLSEDRIDDMFRRGARIEA